jgi:hypothetical protein
MISELFWLGKDVLVGLGKGKGGFVTFWLGDVV